MFNDRLSNEVAEERIAQRMKEVESYELQKRLGYSDYRTAKWILVLVLLMVAVVVVSLL